MPAATWALMEQTCWLQEQLPVYMEFAKEGDYTQFWPALNDGWFSKYPERAVLFPDISINLPLSPEQDDAVEEAQGLRKVQLRTWYRWRTNGSKKNRSLKKKCTVFDNALKPKRCAKTEAEIYSEMYYDKHIKPLVMAEAEAGNVTTSGKHVALAQKFSKELLEDETEDVKADICSKYKEQLQAVQKVAKHGNNFLDLDDEVDDEMDAKVITQGIDDLPVICRHFAQLVKQKTRFVMSFMFAGPDPRNGWDMTTLSCHPSETPQGKSFTEIYEMADREFLEAFQHYAEEIFPANKRKLDATTMSRDDRCETKGDDEDKVEEHDAQLEEDSLSHQGGKTQPSWHEDEGAGMGTLDSGVFFLNLLSDASSVQPRPVLGNASITLDASIMLDASIAPDASAVQSGPDLGHASITPDALIGVMDTSYDTAGRGHGTYTYNDHALYRMQPDLAYDAHAHITYHSHMAYDPQYGTENHLTYDTATHDLLSSSQTDASFQVILPPTDTSLSQGSSLPMQTTDYAGFGVITPTFSLTDAPHDLQDANWNFDGVGLPSIGGVAGTPHGGWRLSDLLSPISAERSSLAAKTNHDSLPVFPTPLPAATDKDSLPVLPSPVVPPGTSDISHPLIGKAGVDPTRVKPVPKPGKKCLNAKSITNKTKAATAKPAPIPKDSAAATKILSNPIAMIEVTGPANANAMDSAVRIKRVPM
ncbi:uncharacterized protein HD556DRAFT_1437884 [Suillus plorans]|uniref:Uncharacterized protein n=1 Tax=Suillus plorans TaxID=116603 RepID=A0A9P7DTU4_9AGAM|nr:uncharacterized protein HD556DRAFT_1437884 [Suillus plorans]KAG1802818.1 hypothetical protein HD556DRAFT_1437884 [Suillus plorans]